MTTAPRYTVETALRWVCTDGRTASVYGAVPYLTEAEGRTWSVVPVGYTIYNLVTGTRGIGRAPFATEAEALAWIATAEARHAAYAAALAG
jgi:hypothetical protein